MVELIPCSAAQGISGGSSCNLLDSQLFSGRFFAENGGIGENSLLIPCYRGFWFFGRPADRPTVGTGHAQKRPSGTRRRRGSVTAPQTLDNLDSREDLAALPSP